MKLIEALAICQTGWMLEDERAVFVQAQKLVSDHARLAYLKQFIQTRAHDIADIAREIGQLEAKLR